MTHDIMTNEKLISLSFDRKIKLHIVLKDGRWRNGYVTKKPTTDVFYFEDDLLGEEPYFFLQLKENGVRPCREDETTKGETQDDRNPNTTKK